MNYIISIVEEIKPKNIITLIDNSPEFYELSNVFYNKGLKLIAIQNANRTTSINKKISNFFIPNYFTIGEFENKVFQKNLDHIKNIKSIGSVRAANAKKYFKNSNIGDELKYDICLISEPHINSLELKNITGVERQLGLLAEFTLKFCKRHNKSLIFSGKSDVENKNKEAEIIFYKNNIKNFDFNIEFHKKNDFGTYRSMVQSEVTIGSLSTLLREAFLFNKKILSCDFIAKDETQFASTGINYIKKCSFEEFEQRLLEVLSLDYKDYLKKVNNINAIYNTKINTLEFLKNELD